MRIGNNAINTETVITERKIKIRSSAIPSRAFKISDVFFKPIPKEKASTLAVTCFRPNHPPTNAAEQDDDIENCDIQRLSL